MGTVYRNFKNNILIGVSEVTVTSPFGPRTYKDASGTTIKDTHYGIDLLPVTLLKAPADAIVESITNSPTSGLILTLRHGDGYKTVYKHLKVDSIAHRVGEYVDKNRIIAHAGATGSAVTGAHTHYEVQYKGVAVDPLPYLLGDKVIPPYIPKSSDLENRPDLPMFHFHVSSRVRVEPNVSAVILAEPVAGSMYPYLGHTIKVDGYHWARIDFEGKIGYVAIDPTWNTITYPLIVPPPFTAEVEKEGMVLNVSLKPIVK